MDGSHSFSTCGALQVTYRRPQTLRSTTRLFAEPDGEPADINATIVAALATAGAAGGAVLLADPLLDGAAVGGAADLITTYSAATATVADTVIYRRLRTRRPASRRRRPSRRRPSPPRRRRARPTPPRRARPPSSTTLVDATAGSGAGEGIGAGAAALAGLGASVFGDSSTTGVATRGATKVVSKAAKQAPDAVTKVGKGLAAQSDVALKSAKAAAQSDAARLASKAPVEAVTKVAKAAGSPTTTKLAKGLATNADAATKAVKVAPEGFTKLGKGLAASGVAEGVASKAGLFAEASGKAGALGESTTALAAKVAPVLDSTVAKATLGAAEGAGLAAGFTGVTVAGAEYMKQNLGVVLGIGALLGLAKWAGDALNEPKDGPLDKLTKK